MIKSLHNQRGASILEFVIVTLPVLIILAFTVIEFGAVFTRYNTLTKSVQDATRYLADTSVNNAILPGNDTIAVNLVKYGSVSNTGSPILAEIEDPTVADLGEHVQVSVTYRHTPILGQAINNLLTWFTGGGIDLSIDMTASSVMRFAQ